MRRLTRAFTVVLAPTMAAALLMGCSSPGRSETARSGGSSSEASPDTSRDAAAAALSKKPHQDSQLLFVGRSASATLSLDATGIGTLEMTTVPTMTWFADRPQHDAGTIATADALAAFGWKKNGDDLGAAAPNAALSAGNLQDPVVVELLNVSRTGKGLTFKVAEVSDGSDPAPRALKLSAAELFIDSVGYEDQCGPVVNVAQFLRGADGSVNIRLDFSPSAAGDPQVRVYFYTGPVIAEFFPIRPGTPNLVSYLLTQNQPYVGPFTVLGGPQPWDNARMSTDPGFNLVSLTGEIGGVQFMHDVTPYPDAGPCY